MAQSGQETQTDGDGRIDAIVEAERRSGANTVPRPETAILRDSQHIMYDPVEEAELHSDELDRRFR